MPGKAELDPLSDAFQPMKLEDRPANDIKSLRALCKATGSVSDERFFDRVFVFHKPESFDRLSDIYQHPDLSKSLRTIVYCPSYFVDLAEHRRWLRNLQILAHNTAHRLEEKSIYTEQSSQTLRDYDALLDLHEKGRFGADMLLTRARSVCQRLNHVVLDCAVYTREGVHNRRAAFKNVLLTSESSKHWKPPSNNDDTLNKVIEGLGRGSRPLESLTMVNVFVPASLSLTVFNHLKHVRVIDSTHDPFAKNFPSAKISGLILVCRAKLLESLQLRNSMLVEDEVPILLAQRFVKLRYCKLSGLKVRGAALAEFLKGHAETLEYLALGFIYLKSGDWTKFTTDVAGHMKRLEQMKLKSLHPTYDSHLPLPRATTDKMIEQIVSFDSTDARRYPWPEQDSPFMTQDPAVGSQDEYNEVCYDVDGNVKVW